MMSVQKPLNIVSGLNDLVKYRISDRTQLLTRPRRTKRDTTRDALGIIRAVQA